MSAEDGRNKPTTGGEAMSDETLQMTKAERDELAKLVRRREKLAKVDTDSVAAERLAQFEQALASIYRPAG